MMVHFAQIIFGNAEMKLTNSSILKHQLIIQYITKEGILVEGSRDIETEQWEDR